MTKTNQLLCKKTKSKMATTDYGFESGSVRRLDFSSKKYHMLDKCRRHCDDMLDVPNHCYIRRVFNTIIYHRKNIFSI